jgi:hypothetical protein
MYRTFYPDVTGDYEFERNGEVVTARNADGRNYDDNDDDISSKDNKLQI